MPPSANKLTFNVEGGGRALTRAYRKWLLDAGLLAKAQARGQGRVTGAYHLKIRAPKPAKARRDIDNICKPISDLLVKISIVPDDSNMQSICAEWVEGMAGDCEITVIEA